jgi:hypothetical protein
MDDCYYSVMRMKAARETALLQFEITEGNYHARAVELWSIRKPVIRPIRRRTSAW